VKGGSLSDAGVDRVGRWTVRPCHGLGYAGM
jgi:hypothetical protein